jgi:hypothetical protein
MSGVDADAALYEIDPKFEQGKIYIRAFCPGAKRLWLSFSRLAVYRDLRVQAFGDDPKGGRPGCAARWTSRTGANGSCRAAACPIRWKTGPAATGRARRAGHGSA